MRKTVKKGKSTETSSSVIPRDDWSSFLQAFSQPRHGWPVELETHDLVTQEIVTSQAMPLRSIELDLEDEKNPRINVLVQLDNKVIKHILFRPSRLVLETTDHGQQSLRVETINTDTSVRFDNPALHG